MGLLACLGGGATLPSLDSTRVQNVPQARNTASGGEAWSGPRSRPTLLSGGTGPARRGLQLFQSFLRFRVALINGGLQMTASHHALLFGRLSLRRRQIVVEQLLEYCFRAHKIIGSVGVQRDGPQLLNLGRGVIKGLLVFIGNGLLFLPTARQSERQQGQRKQQMNPGVRVLHSVRLVQVLVAL